MKRIIAFFLSCVLALSQVGIAYAVSHEDTEMAEIQKVVEEFLSKSTREVYFYEPQNTAELTISTLSSDEKVSAITKLSAQSSVASIVKEDQDCYNDSILPLLEKNIKFYEDGLAYFGHIYEKRGITYSWFDEEFVFENISIALDSATVCVYQKLNYQYSDCDTPTSEIITYNIALAKIDDTWCIAAVDSDSDFYLGYDANSFNLAREVASYDEVFSKQELVADLTNDDYNSSEIAVPLAASNTITYDRQNAANYALTYSTETDNGNVPSYKNPNFYWTDASCMLFASQCIWAGFRGSNTRSDINSKQNMDDETPNTWYSTSSTATTSWKSCQYFRDYVTASNKSSDNSKGLSTTTLYVESDQNTVTGVAGVDVDWTTDEYINAKYNGHFTVPGTKTTPYTASQLVGSVIHGHGKDGNGIPGILGHALVCNKATGITRDKIFVTCYNSCRKNKNLGLVYPAGYTNHNDLYFIVPNSLRTNQTGTQLFAKLENAWGVGKTLTLTGYSSNKVSVLTIEIFREGGTTPVASTSRSNTNSVQNEFTFDSAGTWRIEVSSPGLSTFTYTVRIVNV